MKVQHKARLHEKVVQQIARDNLPRVQVQHTSGGTTRTTAVNGSEERAISTRRTKVAQKVNIVLVDDLDGTEADETLTFGLDGTTYEIDLSSLNAKKLRHAFADYVEVARKVGKSKPKKSAGNTKHIREWARAHGYEVSNRGVVPVGIMQAYEAAH